MSTFGSTAGPKTPIEDRPRSLLDTDLYKLTMQCCVLRYFPHVESTHTLSNRTPRMQMNQAGFEWISEQIADLDKLQLTEEEYIYLSEKCPFLSQDYLEYLKRFRFRPQDQVTLTFTPDHPASTDQPYNPQTSGVLFLQTKGLWVETILYEIPLLVLVTEAYFRFVNTDWTHAGQLEQAEAKALALLRSGCVFSEFATRRRRDFHTQKLVLTGLVKAAKKVKSEEDEAGGKNRAAFGKLVGTSNIYLARLFGLDPIGTVAHEWFMGVAAATNDYKNANEIALRCWVNTFGVGVLPIALTDTYGTPAFLSAFRNKINPGPENHITVASPSSSSSPFSSLFPLSPQEINDNTKLFARIAADTPDTDKTFSEAFTGVRQDSGDPVMFVHMMDSFYSEEEKAGRIADASKKTVIFSDSLTVGRCLTYKQAAEEKGLIPGFGIGTNLTNDFTQATTGHKSEPMNIVIKISSVNGRPAIKLSDNVGKHTGDPALVKALKKEMGYISHEWKEGDDEAHRWKE